MFLRPLLAGLLSVLLLSFFGSCRAQGLVPSGNFTLFTDVTSNGSTVQNFWSPYVVLQLNEIELRFDDVENGHATIAANYYYNYNGQQGFVGEVDMVASYTIVEETDVPTRIGFAFEGAPSCTQGPPYHSGAPDLCLGGNIMRYFSGEFDFSTDYDQFPNPQWSNSITIGQNAQGINWGGLVYALELVCSAPSQHCNAIYG